MCQIIMKPAGVTIPDGMLEKAARLNPNGSGVAYCARDVVKVVTSPMLVSSIEQTELWHFRYSLSGVDDVDSTQPFRSSHGLYAFAHVGVLKDWSAQSEHSDSWNFWKSMEEFVTRCAYSADCKRLLDAYCNVTQNRMVLLESSGTYWIFGEMNGFWQDGLWLSGSIE